MNAADLLKQLEERGIRVRARGDDLAVSGPQAALTDETRSELKAIGYLE